MEYVVRDVTAYMTELAPRNLLRKKLHNAMNLARARLEEENEMK